MDCKFRYAYKWSLINTYVVHSIAAPISYLIVCKVYNSCSNVVHDTNLEGTKCCLYHSHSDRTIQGMHKIFILPSLLFVQWWYQNTGSQTVLRKLGNKISSQLKMACRWLHYTKHKQHAHKTKYNRLFLKKTLTRQFNQIE